MGAAVSISRKHGRDGASPRRHTSHSHNTSLTLLAAIISRQRFWLRLSATLRPREMAAMGFLAAGRRLPINAVVDMQSQRYIDMIGMAKRR